ncbi:MAG TPA: DNA adenine methylase [Polyangiaceae bacterium]|nr:DNA adenine methylase [Polyangiaceae bacterium]
MAGEAAREEDSRARSAPEPARPFLKWAGGKGQLLAQFGPLLPRSHRGYFEPFVGGAALFFARRPLLRGRVVLSDVNAELVNCYRAVRDCVDDVIDALCRHVYAPDDYYRVRALDPSDMAPAERAARTIYLNKAGYNGLYRVNRAGRFNVPFGRHKNPLLCDPVNLRACSQALERVRIEERDFQEVLPTARRGDFVYFDPPYVPVSPTAVFTSYVPGGFDWAQQRRLAAVFAELSDRGVLVMLSNSDTPRVRRLYAGFRIDRVSAPRSINSNATRRGKVGEVVVRNYD